MADKLYIFLVCFYLYVGVTLSTSGTEGTDENNKVQETDIVFKIHHPVGQEILKVGKAGDEEMSTTESSGTGAASDGNTTSTSSDQCDKAPGCCYQYTWPGVAEDNGSFNFTCEKSKKSPGSGPCKNPVVFTYGGKGKAENTQAAGTTRPNLTELINYCDENGCKIYCAKTQKCIKYSYYQNTGAKLILYNETKFCGEVTSGNTGVGIQSGCYQEKMEKFTRQVCVCTGIRCNGSSALAPVNPFTFVALLFLFMTALHKYI